MIEQEVTTYMKNDSVLTGLLGATGADSKIYPLQIPQDVAEPYIIYNLISDGSLEENLLESSLSINVVDDSFKVAETIRNRVLKILDKQDKIRRLIDGDRYDILWAKNVGGADFKDPDMDIFYSARIYSFKYVRREAILLENGEEYLLTEDGERILLQP